VTAGIQQSLADLTPLIDATFVVLDLETTGLSPDRDRITEVGAVRARGGDVEAELRTFVHPGVPIPAAVTAITGITDRDVADAPTIDTVLPMVLDFLGSAVFVAHNARFDLGFLRAAALRLGLPAPRPTVVDTAVLARRLIRDEVRDVRLGTLAQHLRAPVSPDHRALTDARATLHVLQALIERAGSLGATTLEDLVGLCGPTGDRSHRRIGLIRDAPSSPGVYRFFADDGTLLYVGKSGDLRRRLRSYFGQDTRRRTADLVAATARIEWTVTATELEASVLEVRELQEHRPRYNRRSTSPRSGVVVMLTDETFPRLSVVRERVPTPGALGPTTRATAERVVTALESVLPLRPCRPRLRRAQDHDACILKDLHRCAAPCDGTQTPDAYAEVVAHARAALEDPGLVVPTLRERMHGLAREGAFERAAEAREELAATVRAYAASRRGRTLHGARLVLQRPLPVTDATIAEGRARRDRVELVALADGRLITTSVVTVGECAAEADRLAGLLTGPDPLTAEELPGPPDREELALVSAWCETSDVTIRHIDGTFASPVRGGAILREVEQELRRAERAVRGDEAVLQGHKVRRNGQPTIDPGGSAVSGVSSDTDPSSA
jgi:DNA polymerase-3 subunit epsilon